MQKLAISLKGSEEKGNNGQDNWDHHLQKVSNEEIKSNWTVTILYICLMCTVHNGIYEINILSLCTTKLLKAAQEAYNTNTDKHHLKDKKNTQPIQKVSDYYFWK